MDFNKLHNTSTPLLICNVWDVSSTKIAEKLGFRAIGTSSGAIAAMLGYQDGEEMTFEELLFIIKRIQPNTSLPFSVDIEAGYSREPTEIIDHLRQLIKLGVVGVNLEDSIVDQKRELQDINAFSKILKAVKDEIEHQLFINVRTDTYLLDIPNKLEETLIRIKQYEQTGVDGIFIPCLTNPQDIQKICTMTSLPINVMCMPDLPDFKTLNELGVKRISMGNFIYDKIQKHLESSLEEIKTHHSFQSLFV